MQRLQGRGDVLMTFGVYYHAAKSILDELETTEFSLEQTQVIWLLWMQFPNQDEPICDGDHECDRTRLY